MNLNVDIPNAYLLSDVTRQFIEQNFPAKLEPFMYDRVDNILITKIRIITEEWFSKILKRSFSVYIDVKHNIDVEIDIETWECDNTYENNQGDY